MPSFEWTGSNLSKHTPVHTHSKTSAPCNPTPSPWKLAKQWISVSHLAVLSDRLQLCTDPCGRGIWEHVDLIALSEGCKSKGSDWSPRGIFYIYYLHIGLGLQLIWLVFNPMWHNIQQITNCTNLITFIIEYSIPAPPTTTTTTTTTTTQHPTSSTHQKPLLAVIIQGTPNRRHPRELSRVARQTTPGVAAEPATANRPTGRQTSDQPTDRLSHTVTWFTSECKLEPGKLAVVNTDQRYVPRHWACRSHQQFVKYRQNRNRPSALAPAPSVCFTTQAPLLYYPTNKSIHRFGNSQSKL